MFFKRNNFSKKKNKTGAVIIYVVFLLTISLILASIVFDSFILLKNEKSIDDIESDLYINMNEKFNLALKISDYYNSNGSGFIDLRSCPKNFSMSGNTLSSIISTISTSSGGEVFCKGDYFGNNIKISYLSDFSDLSGAIYKGSSVPLNTGLQQNTFADSDSTIIDLTVGTNFNSSDLIDDNMNSDNFLISSLGPNNYPNGFQDDDAMARLKIIGFIKSLKRKNIFWSNTKITNYIDNNANNYDSLNTRLGKVSTGVLFLTVNTGATLSLLKIDKIAYDSSSTFLLNNTLTGNLLSYSGYIQNNAGILSLNAIKTGNEYIFDFIKNDYAFFLKNTGTGILKYTLRGETDSGSGIYLVPLNDSSTSEISYLGNNIIKNNTSYVGKIQELKKYLKFGNGAGNSYVVENYLSGKRWSDGTYASTCNEYRHPVNPTKYKYLGSVGNGYYWLNIPGISTTFLAYCDMIGGGWTVAKLSWMSINPGVTPASGSGTDEFRAVGINPGNLAKFTYDLSETQILGIKSKSVNFKQFFKKRCYRSIVYNNSSDQVKWTKTPNGNPNISGIYFPNYSICDSHNNDAILPANFFKSSGYVFSGALLPIRVVYGGDVLSQSPPGTPSEDSYYQFGDFYMK